MKDKDILAHLRCNRCGSFVGKQGRQKIMLPAESFSAGKWREAIYMTLATVVAAVAITGLLILLLP